MYHVRLNGGNLGRLVDTGRCGTWGLSETVSEGRHTLNTRGWHPMSSPSHTGGQVVPVGGAGRQRCAQSEATIYTATQEGTLGTILGLRDRQRGKSRINDGSAAPSAHRARDAGPVSILADMQPAAHD